MFIASTVIFAAVVSMAGAIAVLFKLFISAKDRANSELESALKSWKDVAEESMKSHRQTIDHYRAKEGKPPLPPPLAPVIPESHSPSTRQQRENAAIATARANVAAIKLAVGQPPRVDPEEHAGESLVPDPRTSTSKPRRTL